MVQFRVSLANFRSFLPPVTIACHLIPVSRHFSLFSAPAMDVGDPEDLHNWHRRFSQKAASHWVYARPIRKSQQDDREYRLIRLDNGLQAMLVHDVKADKAAASLDVAVGHMHDPVSTLPVL
jgi:hypothetical protein